ncbi:tyrosine-protein phosphatase [Thalassotalea aquiviva]|uniref:phosphatase domain-containing protein n=1 Tax=Thalassotalea aquiviva TaxID=3242415 RepID=UPI00352B1FD6
MNTHPFDALEISDNASIIFTPCPGTKEANLEDSVTQLKQAGATMILTMMYDEEMQRNNIQLLPELCKQHGIRWYQLPIEDDEAPKQDFEQRWVQVKDTLVNELKNGGSIVAHCKGGTGRTGLVLGLILKAYGFSEEDAKAKIQSVRPKSLVNPLQLNYFIDCKL